MIVDTDKSSVETTSHLIVGMLVNITAVPRSPLPRWIMNTNIHSLIQVKPGRSRTRRYCKSPRNSHIVSYSITRVFCMRAHYTCPGATRQRQSRIRFRLQSTTRLRISRNGTDRQRANRVVVGSSTGYRQSKLIQLQRKCILISDLDY